MLSTISPQSPRSRSGYPRSGLSRSDLVLWPEPVVRRSAAMGPLSVENPTFDVQVDNIIAKARGGIPLPRFATAIMLEHDCRGLNRLGIPESAGF